MNSIEWDSWGHYPSGNTNCVATLATCAMLLSSGPGHIWLSSEEKNVRKNKNKKDWGEKRERKGGEKEKKKRAIRSFTGIGEKCLLGLWSVMNKSS